MKQYITQHELLTAFAALGFEDASIMRLEVRERRDNDVTISPYGRESQYVLTITTSSIETDGSGCVTGPYTTKTATLPVLHFGDEFQAIMRLHPDTDREELYAMTNRERHNLLNKELAP